MVPVSLHLSNFLSYGHSSETLDFTLFHTACLSGNNGNGKSALLDGMTWALWGEARHTTPALLRLGTSEMRVEFAFDLDGERYRIVRGHTKSRRTGATLLELHVLDPESNLFRPLTGSNMRETQAKLDALLRMDYPTFIASAYLKQGQADRFTRQPPAQRKQILAEILGLTRYQEISDRARAEARVQEAGVAALDAQIEGIERFLAGRGEAQRLFDFYSAALAKYQPLIETLQAGIDERNARKARLEEKRRRAESLAAEMAAHERQLAELATARARLLAQRQDIREWQQQGEAIVADFEAYRAARATLDRWDAIAENYHRLGEEYRQVKDQVRLAAEGLQRRRHELETQLAHEERLLRQQWEQMSRAAEVVDGAARLDAARREESRWVSKRAAHDEARRRLGEAEEALRVQRNRLEVDLHKTEAQLRQCELRTARRHEAATELERVTAELKRVEDTGARLRELQDERGKVETALAQLKQRIEYEQANITAAEQKLKVLSDSPLAQCPLCASALGEHGREHIQAHLESDIAQAHSRIAVHAESERLLREKEAGLEAPAAELRALLSEAPRLSAAAASARLDMEEAEAAARRAMELGSELDHLKSVLQSGEYAPDETRRLSEAAAELEAAGYDPEKHAQAAAAAAELVVYEGEIAAQRFARQQAEGARARIGELRPRLESVSSELDCGRYAGEDTARLARLKAQAVELQYDREARAHHGAAKADCARLENAPRRYDRWKDIVARAGDVEAELRRNAQAASEAGERLAVLQREEQALADVPVRLAELERSLAESQAELGELRQTERETSGELGRQQGILEACAQREDERAALGEQRRAAAREAFVLKQTAAAFGREGIQALIIENAIPELQDEANAILRRLSRNNMQISIESLREKAAGGMRETLDIKISDDRGTREYLMYSGGEAFRVDFALRIALSRLLARRAGAQLRTLIIDEGFGTQDAGGLQQMIDCIRTISEDFSKVLVVTHLDVIKNAFPTRIEVRKEPDTGSHFEVLPG